MTGLPVGLEWTTAFHRIPSHSLGYGEEAEHRTTIREGSGAHSAIRTPKFWKQKH